MNKMKTEPYFGKKGTHVECFMISNNNHKRTFQYFVRLLCYFITLSAATQLITD